MSFLSELASVVRHVVPFPAVVAVLVLFTFAPASAQPVNIDPAYLATMRQQSLSADAVGDFKLQIGDPAGARNAYLEGLALARQLAAADPNNLQWQGDVVVSLWKLATATSDRSAKISVLHEALDLVERLEAQGALRPNQRNWRAMIEAAIARPASQEHPPPHHRSFTPHE